MAPITCHGTPHTAPGTVHSGAVSRTLPGVTLPELVAALHHALGRWPKESETMHVWRRYRPVLRRGMPVGVLVDFASRYRT